MLPVATLVAGFPGECGSSSGSVSRGGEQWRRRVFVIQDLTCNLQVQFQEPAIFGRSDLLHNANTYLRPAKHHVLRASPACSVSCKSHAQKENVMPKGIQIAHLLYPSKRQDHMGRCPGDQAGSRTGRAPREYAGTYTR